MIEADRDTGHIGRVGHIDIDYATLFRAVPTPLSVLTPELVIVEANQAYLEITGRGREELIGRYLFDAFPQNPADPDADGVRNLRASLERVLTTGRPDTMVLQRYDIPLPGRADVYEERYWSPVNTPVLGPDGEVVLVISRVEDATAYVRDSLSGTGDPAARGEPARPAGGIAEPELYARARELYEHNERLRRAHAREHEVALTLQKAMLPTHMPLQRRNAAVRYRPAAESLNVCGDWYDLINLSDDRFAVAVGDVVGRGLEAASVMGQLRSALSASMRVADGPAQALYGLDLYARSLDGALATTTVKVDIDTHTRTLTYSSAGHLPPMLCHPGKQVELLDQATDVPLAARSRPSHRPQAIASYLPGSVLILYTDGLVERRHESIDVGLKRLAESLARHSDRGPEEIADSLLDDLGMNNGTADDAALVVIRL
ncbi:SpoIIE family protein phosphatase [Streptomyces sp. TRM 70361]|uniref:PP2C family protein-serine/threonine phosphatase n=1 Tax=Streptomyces sp. TRM 70361 TaxID=3116553 RepID=UPI002E7B1F69|nr:SpoIIE family protein phosphatase [Streptomyces sp. TRM 70361]MEE1942687.1 SpoIIE family protein phosphatase [Streptomyces sp. TRM 70361]